MILLFSCVSFNFFFFKGKMGSSLIGLIYLEPFFKMF